jgi:hypothetical protein
MDTLGIGPRASRMLSGFDTTTPRALKKGRGCCSELTAGDLCSQSGKHRQQLQQHVAPTDGQPTRCHLQTERKKLCLQVPHCARPRRTCALQIEAALQRQCYPSPTSQLHFRIARHWHAHKLIPDPGTNEQPQAHLQAWPGPNARLGADCAVVSSSLSGSDRCSQQRRGRLARRTARP